MARGQEAPEDLSGNPTDKDQKSKRLTKESFKRAARVLKFFQALQGKIFCWFYFSYSYQRNIVGIPMDAG